MPAYELYLDRLREGFFPRSRGKLQLHVVLDAERRVVEMKTV
jgi:D-glycerate 3-kinase